MKFKSTLLVALACLLWTSCSDVSLLAIDIDLKSADVIISENPAESDTFELLTEPIDPKSTFDANGVSIDNLKEITVKEANIILLSPETGNFDWAKSAEVVIMADGQPDMIIGDLTDVPMGINTLKVKVKNSDISAYMKSSTFTVRLRAITDGPIPINHIVRIELKTKVKI